MFNQSAWSSEMWVLFFFFCCWFFFGFFTNYRHLLDSIWGFAPAELLPSGKWQILQFIFPCWLARKTVDAGADEEHRRWFRRRCGQAAGPSPVSYEARVEATHACYLQHVQLCQFLLQLKSRVCDSKSRHKSQTWVKRVNCSLAESTCSELVWNGVAALYTNVYLFKSLIGPLKYISSPLSAKFTFSVPTFLHQRVKELSPNLFCQQSRSLHGCWYWTDRHIVSSSQFPHSLLVTIQNMKGS